MSVLFDSSIPIVSTPEEFSSLQSKYSNLHLYYLASACQKDSRDRFETMYKIFDKAGLSDKQFLINIKSAFHQASWEMFVAYALTEEGYKVKRFQEDGEGIDFLVSNSDNKPLFYVECTACNPKNNEPINLPNNSYLAQRISNSITPKIDQYNRSSKSPGFINDLPYLIAINVGNPDIANFDSYNNLRGDDIDQYVVLESLYGVKIKDGKNITYRRENNRHLFVPVNQELEKFPTGFFISNQTSQVSGVWFSTESVLNQNLEILGDKSLLVLNSFAKNPFPDNEMKFMPRLRLNKSSLSQELKFEEKDISYSFE